MSVSTNKYPRYIGIKCDSRTNGLPTKMRTTRLLGSYKKNNFVTMINTFAITANHHRLYYFYLIESYTQTFFITLYLFIGISMI